MTMSPDSPLPGERIPETAEESVLHDVETQVDAMEADFDMEPLDNPRRLIVLV